MRAKALFPGSETITNIMAWYRQVPCIWFSACVVVVEVRYPQRGSRRTKRWALQQAVASSSQ